VTKSGYKGQCLPTGEGIGGGGGGRESGGGATGFPSLLQYRQSCLTEIAESSQPRLLIG